MFLNNPRWQKMTEDICLSMMSDNPDLVCNQCKYKCMCMIALSVLSNTDGDSGDTWWPACLQANNMSCKSLQARCDAYLFLLNKCFTLKQTKNTERTCIMWVLRTSWHYSPVCNNNTIIHTGGGMHLFNDTCRTPHHIQGDLSLYDVQGDPSSLVETHT